MFGILIFQTILHPFTSMADFTPGGIGSNYGGFVTGTLP